jgi:uncharacterized Fe-S center protein
MKIDIQPVIETADKTDRICIDMREIEALYVIRLASGINYTSKFSKKELDEFCPNKTVSEMIQAWEESILRRHAEAVEAVATGLHPTWTFERPIMAVTPNGFEYPTKQTETVRSQLDRNGKANYRREARTLAEEMGKMTFVKIV